MKFFSSNRPCSAWVLSAVTLAAGLSACGGSDAPTVPPATAPVITAQPLSLTLAEGGQGSVSVSATSDAGAIVYQWFNVSANANIAGATAASHSFGPLSLGAHATQYNARLTNNVGTTTSSTGTLSVTERSWSPPSPAMDARVRQLAAVVDSNGHTHLLAITGNNLQAGIEARIKLKNADATQANVFIAPGNPALQATETLAVGAATTSISAVANGSGHVMATWHRNGIVSAALYTPGPNLGTAGSWQLLPTRTNSFAATGALDPAVAALGNDGFEFVWRERLASNAVYDIKARRYTISSNSFGAIESLEASGTETRAPRLVSDAAGNVLAAWTFVAEGVVINRRAAGTAWSTSTTFVGSGLPLETLRSAANGKAVLLTSDRLGDVQAARLDLAAVNPLLGAAEIVSNAYGSAPDAFIDNSGRIDVVGVFVPIGNGNTSTVFHRTYLPGTGWSSAQALSPVNPNDFVATGLGMFDPTIAGADAEGNLIVTWQERQAGGDDALSQVHARRFHAGLNQWRAATRVGSSSNTPARTGIAAEGGATTVYADPTGVVVVAASLR